MSHPLSSQTHSTKPAKASNVSALHLSGSTTMKITPLSVVIHHSESPRFKSGEEFEFDIFEAIALKAALDKSQSDFDRTEVTVKFKGGHQHCCQINLGCMAHEVGFADHCFRILEHAQSLKLSQPQHWYFVDLKGQELLALLKAYDLNRQQVANARQAVFERLRQLPQQQSKNFSINARLARLFEKLVAVNPPVGQMVTALNVVLGEANEKIESQQDFEHFLEQIEEWDG
ncbi:LPD25 domain-containing protein [Vibrio fortis]|uniref:LPD25 domain-containing protein n=1 Tax=Vibrio fortis TaxID=212667 RepID=UPI0040697D64